ncbi:MAG: ferritin-like domain-containing protein [Methylophilaceae bacterium]
MPQESKELRQAALHWLTEADPTQKAKGTRQLAELWVAGNLSLDCTTVLKTQNTIPGRPQQPELVAPRLVKRRSLQTLEGRAALIHALAHIEFNALNLALDAIWRFPDMPPAYYTDWLQVAAEEALHFTLLNQHLHTLGFAYGSFPAHDSLWEMAAKTSDDVLARMALIPRTMEARGLDVTPGIRAKLAQAGDLPAAEILDIILRDEIGHVLIGNRWYGWLCEARGVDTIACYTQMAELYEAPTLRGPFNLQARREAGFSEVEMAALPTH